jgi:hypothetical protein
MIKVTEAVTGEYGNGLASVRLNDTLRILRLVFHIYTMIFATILGLSSVVR